MLDFTTKEMKPIFIVIVIIFMIIIGAFIIKKPELEKRRNEQKRENKKWIQDFLDNNISSFSVVISNKIP